MGAEAYEQAGKSLLNRTAISGEDAASELELRMHAARLAAPLVHPKPQPEPRYITLDLPEEFGDAESLKQVHATLLRSIASGETSLEEAKELSAILEAHRRLVETVDLEERIARLEKEQKK